MSGQSGRFFSFISLLLRDKEFPGVLFQFTVETSSAVFHGLVVFQVGGIVCHVFIEYLRQHPVKFLELAFTEAHAAKRNGHMVKGKYSGEVSDFLVVGLEFFLCAE